MGVKMTQQVKTRIKRARAAGQSSREIAEAEHLSKSSVAAYLATLRKSGKPARPQPLPAASADTAAPTPPTEDLPPLTTLELRAWVSAHLRSLQAEVTRCEAAHDGAGAMSARRLVKDVLPIAARLTPPDKTEGGEYVQVRAADIREASERCKSKLRDLLDRVTTDRESWAKCGLCGQPIKPPDPQPPAATKTTKPEGSRS
jgi:hypothetical protein